jgi:hypothetical protein
MTIENVQSDFRDELLRSPLLAAFAPILIDDGTDQEKEVTAALEARGVFIVIDDIEFRGSNSIRGGRVLLDVRIPVAILELPQVSHSPSGTLLQAQVIAAAIGRGLFEFSPGGFDKFAAKGGGIITMGDFNAKVTVEGLA